MKIAVTGGTGFMGSHLAARLLDDSHRVTLLSRGTDGQTGGVRERDGAEFVAASVSETDSLVDAFGDCAAVAHLAGINFERGTQTYEAVHVRGTRNVVTAAEACDVSTLILTSFLRARPDCGSAYHESKWAAEELVRESDLPSTILKPGITYGRGDHLLTHVSRWLVTVPVFGLMGFEERRLRPLAIEDLVDIMAAAILDDRLVDMTVPVLGPEELTLRDAVRRIGTVVGRKPLVVPLPLAVQYASARLQTRVVAEPLVSPAQVRMLAEGLTEPAPSNICTPPPDDLAPYRPFSAEHIDRGVPELRRYGLGDLRFG